MNKRERIRAALRGEPIDRVPLSLWQHCHQEDRTPEGLAGRTVALAQEYDLDLVKLTPCGLYAVEDWASMQIIYPGTEHEPPFLYVPAVIEPDAWRQLVPLDPEEGALGRTLETTRLVSGSLAGEIPFVMTIFSPLTLAFKLAGADVVHHLRERPADLEAGLETLTQTTIHFTRAALAAGADGLFFATQMASQSWLARTEYQVFGIRYDLQVLDAVAGQSAITILHLHGQEIFFDIADRYPIHALSWHDQETAPSLAEARQRTALTFVTGLDRFLLGQGPPPEIQAQARRALRQTKGRGLILAPSCVIPTFAPPEHLQAVREAVLELSSRHY